MTIKKNVIAAFGFLALAVGANAASAEVALMKCGASSGKGYYFDGQGWTNDGISNGKITLVSNANGAEGKFDIRFNDAFSDIRSGYSYLEDGAEVMLLQNANDKLSFVAVHPNYTDQYTFDIKRQEVLWTSHKTGTWVQKVAIYYSECGH